jgi:TolA-binding protein
MNAPPLMVGGTRVLVFVFALAVGGCASAPARVRADDEGRPLVIPPLPRASASTPVEEPSGEAAPFGSAVLRARDPRIARRRPRSRALVLAETQDLERKLGGIPETAPERPAIHLHLAEAYAELAFSASGPDAANARKDALRHYAAIAKDHPRSSQVDEALYYLGLTYEQNGDLMNARRAYYDVVAKTPQSKFIPFAYFAFGEMFFAEAVTDPSKNELALQAYQEVLKWDPAENPLFPEALLRIGETALRMKDGSKAREMFGKIRRDFPTSSAASEIPPGN